MILGLDHMVQRQLGRSTQYLRKHDHPSVPFWWEEASFIR